MLAICIFIIGVGVDFALHYIAQYRNISKSGIPTDSLTREVVEDVGYPIILDAVSNMGFGALLFSVFIPIQYMCLNVLVYVHVFQHAIL